MLTLSTMDNPESKELYRRRLDDLELKAWDSLAHHRDFEGFGFIELWNMVHKESGLRLKTPFNDLASLARRKYQEKLKEVK